MCPEIERGPQYFLKVMRLSSPCRDEDKVVRFVPELCVASLSIGLQFVHPVCSCAAELLISEPV